MTSRPPRRTPQTSRPTRLDQLLATASGRAEMAAVDLAHEVLEALADAFSTSDLTAVQVAKQLGVSEGRVSQIRNGDGNLRISTLAKMMTILGKRAEIKVRADGPRVARRGAKTKQQWEQLFVDGTGVRLHVYEVPAGGDGWVAQPLGPPSQAGWQTFGEGQGANHPDFAWRVIRSEFLQAKLSALRTDDSMVESRK